MPITKSAKKALRQSKTRRVRNLTRINAYRNSVKKFNKLVKSEQIDQAKAMLPEVFQAVDKASKSGVIKPNKAGRLKSSAAKAVGKK